MHHTTSTSFRASSPAFGSTLEERAAAERRHALQVRATACGLLLLWLTTAATVTATAYNRLHIVNMYCPGHDAWHPWVRLY
jgi:hypothetical protein